MKARTIASIRKEIEKHLKVIARERDALRALEEELKEVLDPLDSAVEHLQDCVETLSSQL